MRTQLFETAQVVSQYGKGVCQPSSNIVEECAPPPCAAPPQGCEYVNPVYNNSECLTSCGDLMCDCGDGFCNTMAFEDSETCAVDCSAESCTYLCDIQGSKISCGTPSEESSECGGQPCYGLCSINNSQCNTDSDCGEGACLPITTNTIPYTVCTP